MTHTQQQPVAQLRWVGPVGAVSCRALGMILLKNSEHNWAEI
jgi:hypothetical protein